MTAAASLAELEALDLDDLDAGLAHLRDRERVALVGDDHAGLEGDDVVSVVPLLALLLVGVAAGLDDVQLRDAERVGDRGQEVLVLADVERARLRARPDADGRMPSTTFGYAVALSRSSSVKTVSRCMCARSLVITAAITRSAAPLANSARAICSIIRPVVRSDRPIATVPRPMISTSPPSSDARPKSSALNRSSSPIGGYQYSNPPSRNIGWAGRWRPC